MSPESVKWHILLFLFALIGFADLGLTGPIIVKDDEIIESLEEIDDLNKNNSILRDSPATKPSEPSYRHRDEDVMTDLKQSTIFASLKYDVEILESSEAKKDVELEERYRGPAFILNTDNFVNENIEVNSNNNNEEEEVEIENVTCCHFIFVVIVTLVSFAAVGTSVALIVFRYRMNHIARYGMRELLVTNDNQDYWPQDVITTIRAQ